jgi:hypothetical protein
MKSFKRMLSVLLFTYLILSQSLIASHPSILPLKEQARVIDNWLEIRLDKVLPEIMRRENFDMWIFICEEYNEDPVYLTLVPANSFSARRLSMLVFYDRGKDGVERISVSRYGIGKLYKGVWEPGEMDQWQCLAKVVAERNPKKIGINESETFALGDGLSASLKAKLEKTLGNKYAARLQSAERLAVGWLERRIPEELEVYPHIVSLAHQIIAEAFSNRVITPGITTTEDVVWWIREKISRLGFQTWFQPSISIQRQKGENENPADKNVIHRGDLLHCDIGIIYLGLNTDTQEHAYVLKHDEQDAPQGLKQALSLGNRLQDILISEFVAGRTGNEILKASLAKAKSEGLKASIYTHPLGYHGHAAGPTIGLWDQQDGVPGKGDYPLFYDTCHSIELSIKTAIPEWNDQEIRIALEQDAVFTRDGVYFLDGRQTRFHLIK